MAAAISTVLFLVLGLLTDTEAAADAAGVGQDSPLSLLMVAPIVVLLGVAFWKRDIFLAVTMVCSPASQQGSRPDC